MKLQIRIALFLMALFFKAAFGDSLTVSQKVIFEGFTGAVFTYVAPTSDQIKEKCGDGNVSSKSYSFPEYLPPRNPMINTKDIYSIHFNYTVSSPFGSDAKCAIPLTTAIVWKNQTGTHTCYFTVALGGGAVNDGYIISTGKKHMCVIGKEDGTGSDCYTNDCNSKDDSSKELWIVHAKK